MDFKLNFNTDRPIRILQLTDMQIIDGTQRRYPERLDQESGERWNPQHDEENIYAPMRFLIEASMPDLIVITGDMIYGEFDDSGESLKRLYSISIRTEFHGPLCSEIMTTKAKKEFHGNAMKLLRQSTLCLKEELFSETVIIRLAYSETEN